MDEPIIPGDAAFRIQLPTFEGPLDLLLHLIKKHELDILDLPIAFVTARYLDYLNMMQELDLDVASEYLLMAATLAHIKSKMLLPQNPLEEAEEHEDAFLEDPREQLVRRLLEYQKYRAAAEQLGARPIEGRDVFARGVKAPEAQGPAPLASIDLYKLLDAFQGILKRVQGRVSLEVTAEAITIQERISQLSDLLRTKRSCTFEELFMKDRTRYEVVVTFLALLEMTKLRMTRVYQADPSSPIHVQYALLDAEEPIIPPDAGEASFAAPALDLGITEPAEVDLDEDEDEDEDEDDPEGAGEAYDPLEAADLGIDDPEDASPDAAQPDALDLGVGDLGEATDELVALAEEEAEEANAELQALVDYEVEQADAEIAAGGPVDAELEALAVAAEQLDAELESLADTPPESLLPAEEVPTAEDLGESESLSDSEHAQLKATMPDDMDIESSARNELEAESDGLDTKDVSARDSADSEAPGFGAVDPGETECDELAVDDTDERRTDKHETPV